MSKRKNEFIQTLVSCFVTIMGGGVEVKLAGDVLQLLDTHGKIVSSIEINSEKLAREPEFVAGMWYSQI